jgi:protein arginine kinase
VKLNKIIEQILQHEQNARASLLEKRPTLLLDSIGRAYGILRHAHSMASKEALNLLSCLKLGVDLGFFPEEGRLLVDQLFMETQPAHLQKSSQQKLQAEERDTLRAEIIRGKLGKVPKPDGKKAIERGREGRKEKEDKNGGETA